MKIKFTATRVVDDEHKGTPQETKFKEGSTHDLDESSAQRWIRRGVAVAIGAAKK